MEYNKEDLLFKVGAMAGEMAQTNGRLDRIEKKLDNLTVVSMPAFEKYKEEVDTRFKKIEARVRNNAELIEKHEDLNLLEDNSILADFRRGLRKHFITLLIGAVCAIMVAGFYISTRSQTQQLENIIEGIVERARRNG